MSAASNRLNACLTGAWLCCLVPALHAANGVDICGTPKAESHLSIAYYDNDSASFGNGFGETDRQIISTDLLIKANDRWTWGAGYRYTILGVAGVSLQANGHLHTFFFPVHRRTESNGGSFRFSFAPALSASSNIAKDPGEYTSDAVQLLAAAVWSRRLGEQLALDYGLCGDHRFGEFQVHPVISVSLKPHPDWQLDLGLPVTRLRYQLAPGFGTELRIAPDGNHWYVRDKDLQESSDLIHEAYLLDWSLDWRARQNIALTASVGREFHSRYEFTLLDGDRVRVAGDASVRVGIGLSWYF